MNHLHTYNKIRALTEFGKPDDLIALGQLTLDFAALDESLSLTIETILKWHPEWEKLLRLRRAVAVQPISSWPFDTKRKHLRRLIRKISAKSGVGCEAPVNLLEKMSQSSRKRNAIIHGYLGWDDETGPVFLAKGNKLPAKKQEILAVTEAVSKLSREFSAAYFNFVIAANKVMNGWN